MSSNPQPSAVDLDSLWREDLPAMPKAVADALDDWIMRRFGKESSHHGAGLFLNLLAEEGYEVTPQASSAERSEESLVSAVAEGLRDFKFEVGPNTLEMLKVGQAVYLTPEERHQIAHAAVRAHRQVVADE